MSATPPHDAKQLLEGTTPGADDNGWRCVGSVWKDASVCVMGEFLAVAHVINPKDAPLLAAAPRLARENIALTERVRVLEEALRPFAALATKKTWPDAPGETGLSPLDHIEGKDGTGELFLSSHFGTTREEALWRSDFERAAALQPKAEARQSKGTRE